MKTRKQLIGMAIFAIIAITAMTFAGCKDEPSDPPPEQPQTQPDTVRTLSFGTAENPCSVTIKSDDKFLTAEWTTLCDKTVAAVERGYDSTQSFMQEDLATYFSNNTVSVLLLKSATYDCEVKLGEVSIMYLKANGSAIDGLSGDNMSSAILAVTGTGNSFHYPE